MGRTNELGDLLRSARERSGLNQVTVADRAGIAQSQLNQCESGKRGMSDAAIVKVCEVLRIGPERALLASCRDRIAEDAPQLLDRVGPEPPSVIHGSLYAAQGGHSDFHVRRVAVDVFYDADGRLQWVRNLSDLAPNPDGRTVHSVLFRDQMPAVAVGGNNWSIPPIEYTVSRRVSGQWLEHEMIFPRGWTNDGQTISGAVSVQFPPLPPKSDIKRSAIGYRPAHHLGELIISVRSACGWKPNIYDALAWRGEHGVEWALGPNLITRETCAEHSIAPTSDGLTLTVLRPLANFTFALIWPTDGHHHANGICTLGGPMK